MSIISLVSAEIPLLEYSQGASQFSQQPVGLFLAPLLPVETAVGWYKAWTDRDRFWLPKTERAMGGQASDFGLVGVDTQYECTAHGVNYPVDRVLGEQQRGLQVRDGELYTKEVAQLKHATLAINKALAAAGAGTAKVWSGASTPVQDVDNEILTVMKRAKSPNIGVLFGATAWHLFKNNSSVLDRSAGALRWETNPSLFHGSAEYRTAYVVTDTKPEGVAESIAFLLDANVLIFARCATPNRRDQSFMKTFALVSDAVGYDLATRKDGRVDLVKFDWSHDVRVTNTTAVSRLNIS